MPISTFYLPFSTLPIQFSNLLSLSRAALHVAAARVAFAADTGDRLDLLSLLKEHGSALKKKKKIWHLTHLRIFIASLLPLLGHRARRVASKRTGDSKQRERHSKELCHLDQDLPTLALGGLCTGTVRSECDPVG